MDETSKKDEVPMSEERKKLQAKLDKMTRDFSNKLRAEAEKVGVSLEVVVSFREQPKVSKPV
jgi:hypothetical protein